MIRRAKRDDLKACATIVTDWERSREFLPEPPSVEVIAGYFEDAFDAREIWVTGDPVDGYLSLDPVEGKVGGLFMTKPGSGMGKRLLDLAKGGRDSLWLTVYMPNTRALAFYEREGFAIMGIVSGEREGEPDMYRMDWRREAS